MCGDGGGGGGDGGGGDDECVMVMVVVVMMVMVMMKVQKWRETEETLARRFAKKLITFNFKNMIAKKKITNGRPSQKKFSVTGMSQSSTDYVMMTLTLMLMPHLHLSLF